MRSRASGPGAFQRPPLRSWKVPVLEVVALALVAAFPVATAQETKETQQAASTQDAAAAKGPATYVGSDTCQPCHEDIYKTFQKNRHVIVETAGKYEKWNKQACEACHGPGSIHAETTDPKDIFNPAKAPSAQADKSCLSCHLNQPTHVGRMNGSHARSAVTCTACHSIHGPAKQASLDCTACHANVWAEFNKPFGHKLGKNTMNCVDCHNPHGGNVAQSFQRVRSMQAYGANEPGCFKCHANYRGPFTFEHAPVRNEGCVTCHAPHNSVNPRMLNRHEIRFTCLECHSNIGNIAGTPQTGNNADRVPLGGVPTGFHDLNSPRFRNCTICHVKIHGSYANRDFLR